MTRSFPAANELNDGARERILAAAKAEFAAHGLRAASVRAIGARAGVTGAMINYYFGSKRALYDQIVATAQARLHARVTDALAGSEEAELPARLTAAYFDFLSEEREFQRLMIREVLDRPEGLREFVRRYIVPLRALFEDLFGRGDDAFQAAISLFGAVAGYFLYEPVLTELLGEDAMAEKHLERRRRHLMTLAVHLSEWAQ